MPLPYTAEDVKQKRKQDKNFSPIRGYDIPDDVMAEIDALGLDKRQRKNLLNKMMVYHSLTPQAVFELHYADYQPQGAAHDFFVKWYDSLGYQEKIPSRRDTFASMLKEFDLEPVEDVLTEMEHIEETKGMMATLDYARERRQRLDEILAHYSEDQREFAQHLLEHPEKPGYLYRKESELVELTPEMIEEAKKQAGG